MSKLVRVSVTGLQVGDVIANDDDQSIRRRITNIREMYRGSPRFGGDRRIYFTLHDEDMTGLREIVVWERQDGVHSGDAWLVVDS